MPFDVTISCIIAKEIKYIDEGSTLLTYTKNSEGYIYIYIDTTMDLQEKQVIEQARAVLVTKMDSDTVIHHLRLKTVLSKARQDELLQIGVNPLNIYEK
jgi:hypothetical protein